MQRMLHFLSIALLSMSSFEGSNNIHRLIEYYEYRDLPCLLPKAILELALAIAASHQNVVITKYLIEKLRRYGMLIDVYCYLRMEI